MKWPRWPAGLNKKFAVKVKPLKLQASSELARNGFIGVELKWKGPNTSKYGLKTFRRTPKPQTSFPTKKNHRTGESNFTRWEWESEVEFESICTFSVFDSNDNSSVFAPWEISFKILLGKGTEYSKRKLGVLGKASVDLAQLASKMQPLIETKVPITLQAAGFNREASLLISVSFVEIRNSQDVFGSVQDTAELDQSMNKEDGFFRKILRRETKVHRPSFVDSDESTPAFDSDSSPNEEPSPSSDETRLDSVSKLGFSSWKRKRSNSRSVMPRGEPSITKTNAQDDDRVIDSPDCEFNTTANGNTEPSESNLEVSDWEVKELVSRDGQTKLTASVFFASFDQCSERAAGESACTALVAIIAHWLHSNPSAIPTRLELDNLITEGSSEWRKLCNNEAYANTFPDKHFDLETVLQAGLRPLAISPGKSFVGFFSPEKFKSLKGTMSFDEIWDEIAQPDTTRPNEPRVYIVSWSDHFFVLKVEKDACYLIDTLGERLFEGGKRAFMLKFDDSASMRREAKEGVGSEEVICSGKECCREYMKRFLAAIPVSELEALEEKGTVQISLHHRLQIEFHFCSSPTPSSSFLKGV